MLLQSDFHLASPDLYAKTWSQHAANLSVSPDSLTFNLCLPNSRGSSLSSGGTGMNTNKRRILNSRRVLTGASTPAVLSASTSPTSGSILQPSRPATPSIGLPSFNYLGPSSIHEPLLPPSNNELKGPAIVSYQPHTYSDFRVTRSSIDDAQSIPQVEQQKIKLYSASYGGKLLALYSKIIHPVFPVIPRDVIDRHLNGQGQDGDTLLIGAAMTMALPWLKAPPGQSLPENLSDLERCAFVLFYTSIRQPTLASVQAGLLLLQTPTADIKSVNTQIFTAATDIGLFLDCSSWDIPPEEKSLRKRLGWAVFMQDVWCATTLGRPPLIRPDSWAMQKLGKEDMDKRSDVTDEDDVKDGEWLHFLAMIDLTIIVADILNNLYTLKATGGLLQVDTAKRLEQVIHKATEAKLQSALDDWHQKLPQSLQFNAEDTEHVSAIGSLHLAYHAAQMMISRAIVRTILDPSTSLPRAASESHQALANRCRGIGKTRLFSALEFLNRLQTSHLTAFWYFPSRTLLALIGSFGALLCVTAPSREEDEFYKTTLKEYRWTLTQSLKHASFIETAIEHIDSLEGQLSQIPVKPAAETLPRSATFPDMTSWYMEEALNPGSVQWGVVRPRVKTSYASDEDSDELDEDELDSDV